MKTKKASLALMLILTMLCIASCNNPSNDKTQPAKPADTPVVTKPADTAAVAKPAQVDQLITPKTVTADTVTSVKLVCISKGEDKMGIPKTDVMLSVNGKQTKLGTINNANNYSPNDFPQYNIPKKALDGCGGWWAGGGDYFYVIMRDGKPVVFKGWQDEGQKDEGYHWKEMKMNSK